MGLLLIQLALGHGGESHGEAAPIVPSGTGLRLPLSSEALDVVLRLPTTPQAGPQQAQLMVANASTSAPIRLSSATLNLMGPSTVSVQFQGTSGVHTGEITLSQAGNYAGSLVVDADGTGDLFSVSGLQVMAPPFPAAASSWNLPLLGGGLVLVFGLGFIAGHWRRGAALALLWLVPLTQVDAHGGEDHGAPAAATVPGNVLTLNMESQFLIGLRTLRVYQEAFAAHTLGLGSLSAAPGGAATLRASVAGTLQAAGAFPAPGSWVQAGQVLALLRETPSSVDRAALLGQQAEAEARLAEAQAALRLAQRDVAQIEKLGSALSERERLERQNAETVAKVAVREAERAATGGGLVIPITAPLSGRLEIETAHPGDAVQAGEELFHVVSSEALWLRASVPESINVPSNGSAEVTLPSLPGRVFPAVVLDGGVEANPQTGTLTVTLALAPDPALRPGLAATAWITAGGTEDVLTVPDDAVVESNGSTLVFVKTGPERFELREVALGARNGSHWEVHAGLQASERVVVAGSYALKSLAGR